MKKTAPQLDETLPDAVTLDQALSALDRQARLILTLIANEPARQVSTHEDRASLSAVELAIGDMLVALAKRRMGN
jgi:hypothetical protein